MSLLCKIGLHKWKDLRNTGKISYQECKKCGHRRIKELVPNSINLKDTNFLKKRRQI
jgi:hypothetical protein